MRRRVIAAGVVLAIGVLVAVTGLGKRTSVLPPPVELGLRAEAPASVTVGEPYSLTVTGATGNRAWLTIDDGYRSRVVPASVSAGSATFNVHADATTVAGRHLLMVSTASEFLATEVEVLPGPAVDPLALYLGPRTVVADGQDRVMVVAIPTDAAGNPVVPGTDVGFTAQRVDASTVEQERQTEGLLAWVQIPTGTVAGRARVDVEVGEVSGPTQTFVEVAGVPERVVVSVADNEITRRADGHSLVRFATDELIDRFGNQLPDGTVAYLDVEGPAGQRRLGAITIDGRAEFVVESPDRPGRLTVTPHASGVVGRSVAVFFVNAVGELPHELRELDRVSWAVDIGPVRSTEGSYVPDGTPALVTLADGEVLEQQLLLGTATVSGSNANRPVAIEVLGLEVGL